MRLVSVVPVLVVICYVTSAMAAPWHKIQQSQVCGDKLADMMSLMCSDRGYNFALKPEVRRFRRGIVEECCRKSCSAAVLQLYCRAEPTDPPSNVQIRKRSDSGSDTSDKQTTVDTSISTPNLEVTNTDTTDTKTSDGDSAANLMKQGENKYKVINLLQEHSTHKFSSKALDTKVPNDTTEELLAQSNIPPLRHHKNHHHHNRRKIHNRRASNKTKRDKIHHGGRSFEIGTVRPYFAGRAFASYRTSNLS